MSNGSGKGASSGDLDCLPPAAKEGEREGLPACGVEQERVCGEGEHDCKLHGYATNTTHESRHRPNEATTAAAMAAAMATAMATASLCRPQRGIGGATWHAEVAHT